MLIRDLVCNNRDLKDIPLVSFDLLAVTSQDRNSPDIFFSL